MLRDRGDILSPIRLIGTGNNEESRHERLQLLQILRETVVSVPARKSCRRTQRNRSPSGGRNGIRDPTLNGSAATLTAKARLRSVAKRRNLRPAQSHGQTDFSRRLGRVGRTKAVGYVVSADPFRVVPRVPWATDRVWSSDRRVAPLCSHCFDQLRYCLTTSTSPHRTSSAAPPLSHHAAVTFPDRF